MRKLIAVLLIALFAYDVTVDAFDADCVGSTTAKPCHCKPRSKSVQIPMVMTVQA